MSSEISSSSSFFFFFNDTATTEIYTLSLHDALRSPLCEAARRNKRPMERIPEHRCDRRRHIEEIGEHTSELQSLAYLVCRLLLEKKKKKKISSPTKKTNIQKKNSINST